MGKDLKGKELGTGISQRKNGLYTGRFTRSDGERVQKYFSKLKDCREWIAEAQYNDAHNSLRHLEDITVDAWYHYWMSEVKAPTIRPSTKKSYDCVYDKHIKPYIGKYLVKEVRPIHCQQLLNVMAKDGLKISTMRDVRTRMYSLFSYAVENLIIQRNPVTKSVTCQAGAPSKDLDALSLEEQKRFIIALNNFSLRETYSDQFKLLLQTGLRCGELVALTWSDVDFTKRIIHVTKTIKNFPSDEKEDETKRKSQWIISEPKTKAGRRDIPMTEEAYMILIRQRERWKKRKVLSLEFGNYVFLSENGIPISNSTYNSVLKKLCKQFRLRSISPHMLRHTFATRCIEAGMNPKTLQAILGHSSIKMTLDLYVHVTQDHIQKEMSEVQNKLKVV